MISMSVCVVQLAISNKAAISLLSSFEITGGIESGLEALRGFRLSKSFLTPEFDISMSGLAEKRINP